MSRPSLVAAALAALVLAGPLALVTGCSSVPEAGKPISPAVASPVSGTLRTDAWVVVMFENRTDEFDGNLMDALLDSEMRADEALAQADAGRIDGNDVGAYGYEQYFVGDDADSMWETLETAFRDAPVPWTQVEARNGLEDTSPTLILPG